jgi:hypothetical protein
MRREITDPGWTVSQVVHDNRLAWANFESVASETI